MRPYVTRIAAVTIGLAAIPWIASGAETPIVIGMIAVFVSLGLCVAPRVARLVLLGLCGLFVVPCGLAIVNQSPQWAPLQIDGVSFNGAMLALPIASVVTAVLVTILPVGRKSRGLPRFPEDG